MFCPITYWSRWATRVLGAGIEARRASLEGRSGGGGSGTGWGVISARALVAQKPQMRVVESKPPPEDGTFWVEPKGPPTGFSVDLGNPKGRRIRTTHTGQSNTPFDGVSYPEWAGSAVRSCGGLGNLARVIGSIHLHNVRIRVGDGGIK